MKQWAKEDHGKTADERPARILRKLIALTPSNQKIVLEIIETAMGDNSNA
jgi:hypothetical protein